MGGWWVALVYASAVGAPPTVGDARLVPEPDGAEPPATIVPAPSGLKTRLPDSGVGIDVGASEPSAAPTPPNQVVKKDDGKKEEPKEAKKEAPAKDDAPQLSLKWSNGVEFVAKSKDFRYHVGGRMHLDSAWFNAPDAVQTGPGGTGPLQDGSTIRRARVRLDGVMYEVVEWTMEYDFASAIANGNSAFDAAGITEFAVELVEIPCLGSLRVGNTKEPYSLEHLTGVRFLDFIERSPNYDAFAERFSLGYTPGALLHNTYDGERGTWWLGVFHDTNTPFGFGVGDQHYAYDARLTYLPLWDECGERWLHVGVGFSHRNLNNNQVRLRARPSLRSGPGPLTPSLADTGTVAATLQDVANVELMAVSGPWSWETEYYATWVWDASTVPTTGRPAPLGDLFFSGWYTQVLYFLTGETKPYNRKNAAPDRVKPRRNARWGEAADGETSCPGWGAWQVGARFSHTDLRDAGIGATIDDVALGLNWYLNPNLKIQANYVVTHRSASQAQGWINGFGTRFALDF